MRAFTFLLLPWAILTWPAVAGDLPLSIGFGGKAGAYTVEQWRRDWPGCAFQGGVSEGRLALEVTDGKPWLRVNFAPGKIGPAEGGAGWRWPVGTHAAAELSYRLRFGEGFDFVKGGKLPGLCGGPENVSGGHPANGSNGFSARLMWRREGRGEAYVYHKHQPGKYGESFPFPEDFRFPTGQPIQVRLAVTMNRAGHRDGTLRVWITLTDRTERLVVERRNLEWRNTESFGVDGLYFDTFHGGGDASWAPTRPCWAAFADFKIRAPRDKPR